MVAALAWLAKCLARMLSWGVVLGLIGFAGGFFGPMIFAPDANQGPMLGIFITGPLAFLAGLALGLYDSLAAGTRASVLSILKSLI